ncbi:hypothetical protein MY10362_008901 [Beauveria mimosiformis]
MEPQLVQLSNEFSCYVAGYNGLSTSENEAKFIYKEIFKDKCYDISQSFDPRFVIDVGANIGLFSVYIKNRHPECKVLAFEPAPDTFAVLSQNIKLHNASDVKAIQCALGSEASEGTLTFFPHMPGNSTFYPGEKQKLQDLISLELGEELASAMYGGAGQMKVPIKRLSDVLKEESFAAIDLLKIDVEGAELSVLEGIDDEHWGKIQNVVLETCDLSGVRGQVDDLLKSKGFTLQTTEPDWNLRGAKFHTIIARREPVCGGRDEV